jgi:hypothetical protein
MVRPRHCLPEWCAARTLTDTGEQCARPRNPRNVSRAQIHVMRKRDVLDIARGRSLAASGQARSIRESAKVSQARSPRRLASALGRSLTTERQAGHHSVCPCHRRPGVARSVRRTPDAARGHRILSRGRSVKKASTSSGTPATLWRTQAVVRPCRRLNSHVRGGDCPRSRPTSLARCSDTRDQAACWTASVAQPASAIPERFTSS